MARLAVNPGFNAPFPGQPNLPAVQVVLPESTTAFEKLLHQLFSSLSQFLAPYFGGHPNSNQQGISLSLNVSNAAILKIEKARQTQLQNKAMARKEKSSGQALRTLPSSTHTTSDDKRAAMLAEKSISVEHSSDAEYAAFDKRISQYGLVKDEPYKAFEAALNVFDFKSAAQIWSSAGDRIPSQRLAYLIAQTVEAGARNLAIRIWEEAGNRVPSNELDVLLRTAIDAGLLEFATKIWEEAGNRVQPYALDYLIRTVLEAGYLALATRMWGEAGSRVPAHDLCFLCQGAVREGAVDLAEQIILDQRFPDNHLYFLIRTAIQEGELAFANRILEQAGSRLSVKERCHLIGGALEVGSLLLKT
jgi:hypothetical protein